MKTIRKRKESGAALVEMALVMPLLLLLLFGIIEFAWLFSQNLDVRHGAREGARLAAVNHPVGPLPSKPAPADRTTLQAQAIIAATCARMDIADGAHVTLTSEGDLGVPAQVTVTSPAATLTGLLDWLIPDDLELASTVEIRVEQYSSWSNVALGDPAGDC